jgi:hypothetical protein
MRIPEGTPARCFVRFTQDGEALDPYDVRLLVRPGGATEVTTYTHINDEEAVNADGIVRDAEGKYHRDVPTAGQPGTWIERWEGRDSEGTLIVTTPDRAFEVTKTVFVTPPP